MIEKPFMKQFEEAFDKESRGRKGRERKWMLENPRLTVAIVFLGLALLVVLVFITLGQMLYPLPPVEYPPVMTIAGFVDWVFQLQMPAVLWVVVFALLWLTKWN